jgi:hypothetical protein
MISLNRQEEDVLAIFQAHNAKIGQGARSSVTELWDALCGLEDKREYCGTIAS